MISKKNKLAIKWKRTFRKGTRQNNIYPEETDESQEANHPSQRRVYHIDLLHVRFPGWSTPTSRYVFSSIAARFVPNPPVKLLKVSWSSKNCIFDENENKYFLIYRTILSNMVASLICSLPALNVDLRGTSLHYVQLAYLGITLHLLHRLYISSIQLKAEHRKWNCNL